jgi:hypothetical protein
LSADPGSTIVVVGLAADEEGVPATVVLRGAVTVMNRSYKEDFTRSYNRQIPEVVGAPRASIGTIATTARDLMNIVRVA